MHRSMKLLSLRGSEPSKVSGSLTFVPELLSRRRSSVVMSVIASARFGVSPEGSGVPSSSGSGISVGSS